ncbi:hypothetical protein TL16_g06259 [Triparma laevis f. inornata]|uniref:START domain-containing protein n=1 Tax=Triparma laevis f. inornata TaxID=1714386 RepID=A0A9W7ECC4_9STRA|nr:hypothetical protein TL16_g06259 [Triparma laevis f. inornata]
MSLQGHDKTLEFTNIGELSRTELEARLQAALTENERYRVERNTVVIKPLDPDDYAVNRGGNDLLSKTTNICSFSNKVHEEPEDFLQALLTDQINDFKVQYQKVVEDNRASGGGVIVYWGFMKKNKACELLLRLKVERDGNNGDEIIIGVESIGEEGGMGREGSHLFWSISVKPSNTTFLSELKTTTLPKPYSTAMKKVRLLLSKGTILLQGLQFGQTSFTFSAHVEIGENKKHEATVGLSSSHVMSTRHTLISKTGIDSTATSKGAKKKVGGGGRAGGEAEKLLCRIGDLLYDRFKKEDSIDERKKKDFIKNINNAPTLTEGEKKLIARSMKLVEEVSSKAKRVAGTANESVEKYLHKPKGGGAVVGMAVAKVDLSAVSLFANIWLLDSYAKKAEFKDRKIHEVSNLDGTRGLQFTVSVALPGSFQDRLFETWITWENLIDSDGRHTFIIAIAPLETYEGTHHEIAGAENMVEATSTGVHIIKELTENTCEWTRAQQADLKFSSAMPVSVLGMVAKQELAWSNQLQEKFRRNEKEVDRERMAALALKMIERRGKPLMGDQKAVFEGCEELLGGAGEEEWKALNSPSKEVEMSLKYFPPKKGERIIATGKAVGVVDCSAEEVAAWAMDFCSNGRMRRSKEEGDRANFELREKARVNERTFAQVNRFPFFLDNREFVFRMIWKSEEGKVLVAIESIDCEVDYGQFDAGGSIPTWVVNKKVPQALGAIQGAINEFRQDEKVDAADRKEKATFMREHGQEIVYDEEENALLERVRQKFEDSLKDGEGWKQLKSPDVFVKMEATFEEWGSSAVVGRAVTVVDATVEDCAAWEYLKMSRAQLNVHYKSGGGGLDRKVVNITDHSDIYHLAMDFGVSSFAPREWLMKCVWKMLDANTMLVGIEDTEDNNFPIGAGKKYVRASATAFWKYERLNEENGAPQTKVTYYQQADLRGFIPKFVANVRITDALENLSLMREKFDKSLEIDGGRRVEIAKKIKLEEEAGGAEALAQFEALFEERQGWERPSRKFELADTKVQANVVGGKGWGSTSMNVRAEMEEAAAFFWDFGSRANIEISSDVERTVVEDEEGAGGFKRIVKRRQQSTHGGHHHDRSFASEMKLQRADGDRIFILMTGNAAAIETKETVAIQLRRLGGGRTKLEFACEIELGFGVSHGAVKHVVKRRLEEIIGVSIYYQRLVRLEDYEVEDGIALAHDLLWMAPSAKKRVERLVEVLTKSRAMKDLAETLPWFEAMMTVAIEGSLHMNKAVSTKMVCVSEKEAIQIGKNLIPCLKGRKVIAAGVDQWKIQNRAVRELVEKREWFEPFIVVVSKSIVKTAAWGLMWRVTVGAALSMADLITDLYVLWQYWEGGSKMLKYRNASLASLTTSIAIQLMVVVCIQNHKMGARRIFKEVLIVLLGFKGPVDAYRVASGAEKEKDTMLDPITEMTLSKCIEMFAESIPSTIIQTSAIINDLNSGGSISTTTYLSLLVSVLTTGFVSATLSYDWDTDPINRAKMPDFYGYVPDLPRVRTGMFMSLMGISSVKVLLTALLIVCLGYINVMYVVYFIGGDMMFYLVLKAVRGDFRYWLRIDGLAGLAISLLVRVVVKFIVDFAGIFQFRHPNEVGGLYFTLNLFIPVIGLGLVLNQMPGLVFSESMEKFLINRAIELGISLFAMIGFFFAIVDKKYRKTFLSVETAGQFTRRKFLDGDEIMKSDFVWNNEVHWASIRGKVEAWIRAGWWRWEEEKPEWFTDDWKANVPKEMIPRNLKEGGGVEEEKKDAVFRDEEAPIGRHKSLLDSLINRKENNKVAPDGEQEGSVIDQQEFIRAMERRGSISM